jgi:uncharacterized protein
MLLSVAIGYASTAAGDDDDTGIRLMRMGLEVLETGELRVRREDAKELSAIGDGALSFDELLAMAGNLQRNMETAAAATQLPPDVDYERVDDLLVELLRVG